MNERVRVTGKMPEAKIGNKAPWTLKANSSQFTNSPADRILFLQRTIGNQAVQRMIRSGALQAKLRIGKPGDEYEQEADRVADAVIRTSISKAAIKPESEPSIQRVCKGCEDDELRKQATREETFHNRPSDHIPELTAEQETRLDALQSGGKALPESVRTLFEPLLSYNFSEVRIHTGNEAGQMSRMLNAHAFTLGRDIYFGSGKYSPESLEGKGLLAHELTHVVQQGESKKLSGQSFIRNAFPRNNIIQRQLLGGLLPTGVRRMDPAEIAIARGVYGGSIVYNMVLISNATGAGGRPYTLNIGGKVTVIQMGPSAYATPGSNSGLLIHELAHSWQCQHGINGFEYIVNSIESQALGGGGAYCFVPGRWFGRYGAEQVAEQAERGDASIVSHMSSAIPLIPDPANVIGLSVPHWEKPGNTGVVC